MKTISLDTNGVRKMMCLALLIVVNIFTVNAGTFSKKLKSVTTTGVSRIWLNATNTGGAFTQTLFAYKAGATDGVDPGYDGSYMGNGSVALTSLIGDVQYAIQCKGMPFSTADVVPLSFTASTGGSYTLSIDHSDGLFLDSSLPVFIHDNLTGTYTNLKMGGYTFTCDAGRFDDRFQMMYSEPTPPSLPSPSPSSLSVKEDNQLSTANLIVFNENSAVVVKSGDSVLKSVLFYNLNGQLLYANNDVHATEITVLDSVLKGQITIVLATTEDGISVSKKCVGL